MSPDRHSRSARTRVRALKREIRSEADLTAVSTDQLWFKMQEELAARLADWHEITAGDGHSIIYKWFVIRHEIRHLDSIEAKKAIDAFHQEYPRETLYPLRYALGHISQTLSK